MNRGLLYALLAYTIWGLFPLFWHLLHALPATQLTAHRVVWSWAILVGVVVASGQWRALRAATNRGVLGRYAIAAILISINWLIFIWAVNTDHIVETSLGYFINPLLSIFFGMVFFGERLRPLHWLSLGFATAGVIYLTWHYGHIPWIALALAMAFSLYGVVKKTAPLKSVFGLTLETSVLVVPALAYLWAYAQTGYGPPFSGDLHIDLLLPLTGFVTVAPLLLFGAAAQRIPLLLIGILQYIAPTLQILLGTLYFHEAFSREQLTGFSLVWIALAIFVLSEWLTRRRRTAATALS